MPVPYANLTNPQTLNLYGMVADDPESFADLDGHQDPKLPGTPCDTQGCRPVGQAAPNKATVAVETKPVTAQDQANGAGQAHGAAQTTNTPPPHQPVVRFEGSQPERTQLKHSWHHMITHSDHARADLKTALKLHGDLTIRPATGTAYSNPRDNSINIDPNFHPVTGTTAGPQPAPTEAILGHELGHRAGGHDDGPGNMNNVNQHENPVRHDLGLPDRTEY